jgi:hypothetical protein
MVDRKQYLLFLVINNPGDCREEPNGNQVAYTELDFCQMAVSTRIGSCWIRTATVAQYKPDKPISGLDAEYGFLFSAQFIN